MTRRSRVAAQLTHVDEAGRLRMVDVSDKAVTVREAVARGRVTMSGDALRAVRLFASRIADAILEGQQIATEGGVVVTEGEGTEEAATPSEADASSTEASAGEAPSESAPVNEAMNGEPSPDESAESVVAAS